MAINTGQVTDLTGNILQVSAISVDPTSAETGNLTKAYTALVTAGGLNTQVISSGRVTSYSATITQTATATSGTIATSSSGFFTYTINNPNIADTDIVLATVKNVNNTNAAGVPTIGTIAPSAGAVVITITNVSPVGQAFSGGFAISYIVFKN